MKYHIFIPANTEELYMPVDYSDRLSYEAASRANINHEHSKTTLFSELSNRERMNMIQQNGLISSKVDDIVSFYKAESEKDGLTHTNGRAFLDETYFRPGVPDEAKKVFLTEYNSEQDRMYRLQVFDYVRMEVGNTGELFTYAQNNKMWLELANAIKTGNLKNENDVILVSDTPKNMVLVDPIYATRMSSYEKKRKSLIIEDSGILSAEIINAANNLKSSIYFIKGIGFLDGLDIAGDREYIKRAKENIYNNLKSHQEFLQFKQLESYIMFKSNENTAFAENLWRFAENNHQVIFTPPSNKQPVISDNRTVSVVEFSKGDNLMEYLHKVRLSGVLPEAVCKRFDNIKNGHGNYKADKEIVDWTRHDCRNEQDKLRFNQLENVLRAIRDSGHNLNENELNVIYMDFKKELGHNSNILPTVEPAQGIFGKSIDFILGKREKSTKNNRIRKNTI